MINYKFQLKDSSEYETTIFLIIRESCKRIKLSTKLKVLSEAWNKESQSVDKADENYKYTNEHLLSWKKSVAQAVRIAELENKTIEYVKEVVSAEMLGVAKKAPNNSFLLFYQKWMSTVTSQKKVLIRQDLHSYKLIKEFRSTISFEDVNQKFYDGFYSWMLKRGLAINTIDNHVKKMKAVMNRALLLGLHNNTAFKSFKRIKEEVYNVYLNDKEIEAIVNLELSGAAEKARDLFIIGCYTAMRFGDYSKLTLDNIRDGKIYDTQQKTGITVVVPLHPKVNEIMQKWQGVPILSQEKLNVYIKVVCMQAGITDSITITTIENGEKIVKTYKKWELVSSHTARRSAATNMYKAGIPTLAIMKITGHKTETSFMKYIKVSAEENAEMVALNGFFRD